MNEIRIGSFKETIDQQEIALSMALRSPKLAIYENVLTIDECNQLIFENNHMNLIKSQTLEAGLITTSDKRTSSETPANIIPNGIVEKIQLRISQLLRCSKDRMEALNIIKYGINDKYLPHFDFFDDDETLSKPQMNGGQRCGTFIIYLNDVKRGGFTTFPNIGMTITPRAGSGLYSSINAETRVRIFSPFMQDHRFLKEKNG